jgi:hypothetical protein
MSKTYAHNSLLKIFALVVLLHLSSSRSGFAGNEHWVQIGVWNERIISLAINPTNPQIIFGGLSRLFLDNSDPFVFNGDGHPDIFWRNSSTGQNFIWHMNGMALTGGDFIVGQIDMN